ncbi:MAG TPA: signal peptidase I [Aquihabitans sp.]|nr:signal peptidase I [Aquihabitans sp.]
MTATIDQHRPTAAEPARQGPEQATGDTGTAAADRPTRLGRLTRARRLVGRLAAAVAWVVVIAGGLVLLVPALLGLDRYVIVGSSMTGAFDRGSIVFSEDVPVAELEVGDIITYRPPASSGVTQLVTHRIVEAELAEDGSGVRLFRTKGDANESIDPWTFSLADARQNRVVHSLPHVGTVLTFLADPSHRMVLLGIPAGLVALAALRELVAAVRTPAAADETDTASTDATDAVLDLRDAPTAPSAASAGASA